jgi:hypothetical protein
MKRIQLFLSTLSGVYYPLLAILMLAVAGIVTWAQVGIVFGLSAVLFGIKYLLTRK